MIGQVIETWVLCDLFGISNGIKQGCVLAPYFSALSSPWCYWVAFKNCDLGIPIQSRADGSVFNLRRLQVRTKTIPAVVRDLLYADDCSLLAHTLHDAQQLFDRFRTTAARVSLTESLKKTDSLSPYTHFLLP